MGAGPCRGPEVACNCVGRSAWAVIRWRGFFLQVTWISCKSISLIGEQIE